MGGGAEGISCKAAPSAQLRHSSVLGLLRWHRFLSHLRQQTEVAGLHSAREKQAGVTFTHSSCCCCYCLPSVLCCLQAMH
jgi:hypothetical protein